MANQLSITCDAKVQLHAAKAFSSVLNELQINHAVIGGFALSMFGSSRHTEDVDILVDLAPDKIRDILRPQITQLNPHFVEVGLKFCYVPTLVDGLAANEVMLINKGNVVIEPLATNTLGLPLEIDPAMVVHLGERENDSEKGLPVLNPSALILTKLKRWVMINTSTYPPSVRKAKSDLADILFLVEWQAAQNLTIAFQAYKIERPERFYETVKTLAIYLEEKGMLGPWAHLRKVVTAEDWQNMGFPA